MKQRLHILQTKLRPPATSGTVVRDRLNRRLEDVFNKKLVQVIAGAGYGKTTLVAQTLADRPANTVWYRLDETDGDFAAFVGYLTAGFRQHFPGFGERILQRVATPGMSKKHRELLMLELLSESESRIAGQMIVVLDDFHLVHGSPEVCQSVEFILSRISEKLHFIIIGRREPPLKISRYRGMMEVIDIGEKDLSFTTREIDILCRECLHANPDKKLVEKLAVTTQGWAAGLVLFFSALDVAADGQEVAHLFDIDRSKKYVFQYMEENVFDGLPERVRDFMFQSSLLSDLDPDFCNHVFGTRDALDILNFLFERHFFTFRYQNAPARFQYHHLLREFLLNNLEAQFSRRQIQCLHRDIGSAMEKSGDIQGAIRHFISGDDYDRVCDIISAMMFQDFLDCPFRFLVETFEKIPTARIRRDARMMSLAARLESFKGRTYHAIRYIESALVQFRKAGNTVGAAGCIKSLGYHHYITGDILRARREIASLLGNSHPDPFFQVEVAGYLILFASILGDFTEADYYYEDACRHLAGEDETGTVFFRRFLELCYTNRALYSGDFIRADAMNQKLLNGFRELKLEPLLPLTYIQAALSAYHLMKPGVGAELARAGLALTEKLGIYDHQYAWLLYAKALNEYETHGSDQAMGDAGEALDIFRLHKNCWGHATVCELLSLMYQRKGRLKDAFGMISDGFSVIRGLKLDITKAALSLRLAQLHVEAEESAAARQILDEKRECMDISSFYRFRRDLLLSRIYHCHGNTTDAVRFMAAGLKTAETWGYGPWLLRELGWALPVLGECHLGALMPEYIESVMRLADPEDLYAPDFLRIRNTHRPRSVVRKLIELVPQPEATGLRIFCLGKFAVSVGDRDIQHREWRNSRAERIFKYLVLKTGQGFIPKDILLELAWPEEDTDKTNRRFHVALTFLRKLLEPGLERGVASAYILRKNDGYRLDIGHNGAIDYVGFMDLARRAEAVEGEDTDTAFDLRVRADTLYTGRLFEEDLYQEWFAADRQRIHEMYLQVLSGILRHLEAGSRWKECVMYAEKYLAMDRYAETVYCALMRCHARLENPSRIADAYRRCRAAIVGELDSPLNKTTENQYRRLTGHSSEQ